jgi:hypothetical protein
MKSAIAILAAMGLLLAVPMSGLVGSSTHYSFGFNLGVGDPEKGGAVRLLIYQAESSDLCDSPTIISSPSLYTVRQ